MKHFEMKDEYDMSQAKRGAILFVIRDAKHRVSTIRGFVETRCLASLCGKIPVYLCFSTYEPSQGMKTASGSAVLRAIAGIGESEDAQVSERNEEILANEVEPIYAWHLKRD